MPISVIYAICLLVGVIYTIISFVLGGVTGMGDHGGDLGTSGDFSHDYGAGGHGEALGATGDGAQVVFGPFSPIVIAFFLTCFGGTGIILNAAVKLPNGQPLPVLASLPAAALSGFVLAWLLVKVFNRILGGMQSSSEVRINTLIGQDAEVTVAIPAVGVGEIAYIAMGSRYVAPARSDEQVVIPRFAAVRISRIVGNIFFVRPVMEEQLRAMTDPPQQVNAGSGKEE